jgi:hypothetical protein
METAMNCFRLLLDGKTPAPRALDAMDRYVAARDWSAAQAAGRAWLIGLLVLGGVVVAVAMVALLLYRRRAQARRGGRLIEDWARQAGLGDRERFVLLAVARAAKMRNAGAVLDSAAAFERGAAQLLKSKRVASLSGERRERIEQLIGAVRCRLRMRQAVPAVGGVAPAGRSDAEPEAPSFAEGDRLTVVYRGRAASVGVRIAATADDEMLVQPDTPIDCKPGESWLLQYADGGALWEFDAPVVRSDEGIVTLGPAAKPRYVNRRRFPRVPTSKPAHVAEFPMWREDGEVGTHDFVAGELVEIGGTGLKLEAPMGARAGQRVLLALKFAPDRVIEGLGKVRRVTTGENGQSSLVVELLGLNADEVAKLTQETNVAAQAVAAAAAVEINDDDADSRGDE